MFDSAGLSTHPDHGLRSDESPLGLRGEKVNEHNDATSDLDLGGADPEQSTETVEFWKGKAREQEISAMANAAAAQVLIELRIDAEQQAARIKAAEAEIAAVPAKVAEALKGHLIERHGIDSETAELLLTATNPEHLLKQVDRLLTRTANRGLYVPSEGSNHHWKSGGNGTREFVRELFGNPPEG